MAIHILAVLALAAAPVAPASAQSGAGNGAEVVPPPAPNANALANEIRVLAANPNDLAALLNAGELAVKLGDPAAAAGFFARAEKVDPRSGRQRAGVASVLLLLERPGEALRRYGEAEALGYDPVHYAGDRGQAFDLVGDGARAQRDYRLALTRDRDDAEVRRRYALSLANSGDRDGALAQLAPLLRQSDRAAWRVRAFVLAVTGDISGAQDIATQMLPNGMAADLLPFFRRLPQLSPIDRAWAVHFGQLQPTPERLADARLAPSLPPLPVEPRPAPPVQVAAAAPSAKSPARGRKARRGGSGSPVEVAAVKPPAKPVAVPPPVVASPVAPVGDAPPVKPEPIPVIPVAAPADPAPAPWADPAPGADADQGSADPVTAPDPSPAATTPSPAAPAALPAQPESVTSAPPAPTPARDSGPARRENDILARIIAGIGVPAAELGVTPPVPRTTSTPPPVTANPPAEPEPPGAASKPNASGDAAKRDAPPDAKAEAKRRAEEAKKLEAKRKTDAEKATAKRAAEAEAAEARKQAALAKASPPRIWVQVAGGSSAADLARAWAAVRAKAPAPLRGQQGWTTPLRFTNRVLAGPFKSVADAQKLVNALTKAGVRSFVFSSAAGQKIDRLNDQ